MRRPDHIPRFSKALLAATLTGLIAAMANIIYNLIFRSITRYVPDEEFNFFSITLAAVLILIITGLMFFLFLKYLSIKAFIITLIIVMIACVMIACVCITAFLHANPNESAFYGNHGLIAGFILISGLLALTALPYLYNHPKLFI